jgi:RNA 3'-terminal phosphate cyclase (ATP)
LQTVLPALVTAGRPSRIHLSGGTHNPFAPPFDFLSQVFLPLLNRMGPTVRAELLRWGFYPAGGGAVAVEIIPAPALAPIDLTARGELLGGRARAIVAGLPRHIAERECRAFSNAVGPPFACVIEEPPGAAGPGNVILAEIKSEQATELFSAFGRRGVRAEEVARELSDRVSAYLSAGAPVGPYLADQLLIPAAMAGKGIYRTVAPSRHTHTNRVVVQQFIEIGIAVRQVAAEVWEIEVG